MKLPRRTATMIGFIAIVLWSLLAFFTAASGKTPPFQLSAMAFALGGMIGVVSWVFRPSAISALKQSPAVWFLGVAGLFGYHFTYFTALRNAPPVEAGLIAYLWPLLIVVFSALLPNERLRLHHVIGTALGFAGAVLIVTGGGTVDFKYEHMFGYGMALLCALIWSSYSILSRRFSAVPTDVVTGFCLVTAVLSFIAHLMLEETVWPGAPSEWLAVLGLGLGPVGFAFYVWDYGVKHGDIQILGALSYLAPLLSTLVLILSGYSEFSWIIVGACVLVSAGALVAAKDMLMPSR